MSVMYQSNIMLIFLPKKMVCQTSAGETHHLIIYHQPLCHRIVI